LQHLHISDTLSTRAQSQAELREVFTPKPVHPREVQGLVQPMHAEEALSTREVQGLVQPMHAEEALSTRLREQT